MALSIFTPTKRIATLDIDVMISESYNMRSSVSTSPIENGESIQDHAEALPLQINLDCIISNTPLGRIFNELAPISSNASLNAFNTLEALWKNRQLISIVTGLKKFTNMIITNVTPVRSVRNSNGLFFSISLQRMNIVTSRILTTNNQNIGGDEDIQRQSFATGDLGKTSSSTLDAVNEGRFGDIP